MEICPKSARKKGCSYLTRRASAFLCKTLLQQGLLGPFLSVGKHPIFSLRFHRMRLDFKCPLALSHRFDRSVRQYQEVDTVNRPSPSPLEPIQHPPQAGFVALELPDPPVPPRTRYTFTLVEWFVAAGICWVLILLLIPSETGRSGGATHSSRSEREARRLEMQQALVEQEEYLRRTAAEQTVLAVAVEAPSHSE
jgi:hypothetical protein